MDQHNCNISERITNHFSVQLQRIHVYGPNGPILITDQHFTSVLQIWKDMRIITYILMYINYIVYINVYVFELSFLCLWNYVRTIQLLFRIFSIEIHHNIKLIPINMFCLFLDGPTNKWYFKYIYTFSLSGSIHRSCSSFYCHIFKESFFRQEFTKFNILNMNVDTCYF